MPRRTITILIVDTDGTRTVKDIDPDLEAFQGIVGGWIEAIGDGGTWTAYLDEEGKIKGKEPNPVADAVARGLGWQSMVGDFLVGPVVFVGPPDDEGYDTTLTPGMVDVIELLAKTVKG